MTTSSSLVEAVRSTDFLHGTVDTAAMTVAAILVLGFLSRLLLTRRRQRNIEALRAECLNETMLMEQRLQLQRSLIQSALTDQVEQTVLKELQNRNGGMSKEEIRVAVRDGVASALGEAGPRLAQG